jgi:predicted nucleic acid-binding protein
MKPWSDSPVHEDFSIKFFLDTNLLIYLVDNSHQSLNDFVELLNATPFARLVSSRYVIFEFVGVRKREQYLRIAAKNTEKSPNGSINYSSLFYKLDSYKNPNAVFEDEVSNIKTAVTEEVEKIANDFNIDFEYSTFHKDQIQPTIEICLSSKISNQDSLVLVSSALPQSKDTDYIVLLTNDSTFVSSYLSANVSAILDSHSITSPELLKADAIPGNIKLIGKDSTTRADLEIKVIELLIDLISKKMNPNYLGKTFPPTGNNFPNDCISFSMALERKLNSGLYITVLGKDLDFIYTTKKPVEFWNNNSPIEGEFIPQQENRNISCKIVDVDESGTETPVQQEIIDALRSEGNLVFIHPDSQ